MSRTSLLMIPLALLALSGCTNMREVFLDAPPDQVWTALISVAQAPEYDDPDSGRRWTITENQIYVDEPARRIEIYRKLDRVVHEPLAEPSRERRKWLFQITFDERYPPTASFNSRGFSLPMQAREEAERYFNDVHELLGTVPRRKGVARERTGERVWGTDFYWDE